MNTFKSDIQIVLEDEKALSLSQAQSIVTSNETGGIVHTVRNKTVRAIPIASKAQLFANCGK